MTAARNPQDRKLSRHLRLARLALAWEEFLAAALADPRADRFLSGIGLVSVEHNFRSVPFLMLGIPFLYKSGIEFLVDATAAQSWLQRQFNDEWLVL